MSNLIPPLLSSSPPPIVGPLDEEDDDEFGDFRAAAGSYDCDDFSLPPSPQKSPEKELKTDLSKVNLDINCNKSQKITKTTEMPTQNLNGSIVNEEVDKDFQDRRKSSDDEVVNLKPCEIQVNSSDSLSVLSPNVVEIQQNEGNSSQCLDEQILDKVVKEVCVDQCSEVENHKDVQDDFDELQFAVPTSEDGCDDIQHDNNEAVDANNKENEGHSDVNSFSNEEILLDVLSESVQEKTSNSDDLSELNEVHEIKSENVDEEEINSEITDKDNMKDEKFDNSLKEINYDNLSESSISLRVCETDPKLSDDEFGDFEHHFKEGLDKTQVSDDEEEFDEFVDPDPFSAQSAKENADDDFGDFESPEFGDFSSQTCEKPALLEIDEQNAGDKSETILKEVFPNVNSEIDEFEFADETKGNVIFNELKDVTETNALIYQWSKSRSQKMFFKALNIDTRNILYGPAWSCSMPRFAANLGLAPLEPVKSEILTPTPVQSVSSPSNSSQKNNSDIPTAQFDWSGSGLINPLDYSQTMLLDLEQLVASLDIPSTTHPNSNQSPPPSNELLDEWDLWLQSTSAEPPGSAPEDSSQPPAANDFLPITPEKSASVPSLFDTELLEKVSTEPTRSSENDHVTQMSKSSSEHPDVFSPFQSPKLIPLRETHIATDVNDLTKPGWLQPTIVTPDLPRKETVVDQDEDDEFDDFQMVLPEENKAKILPEENKEKILPEVKSSTFDLKEFDTVTVSPVDKISYNNEHIFGISTNSGPISSSDQKQTDDDDEFTEFHSSLPQTTQILKPVQTVSFEPLKPTVQYSTPVAQINWPDPGVTDEDIRNIELNYSHKNEKEEIKKASKGNSLDDDEWSDFVSVTNPIKPVVPERTSTPDLPLSVLNLNHVQAPKQPIPVITPSGLVQTKLSSNMPLQPKSVVQTRVQPHMFRPPATQLQPSIISTQYASNFFAGSAASSVKNPSQDDDDDWSDFVSSQPPPQVNGYQQKINHMRPPPINWTNATTNIIMNPTFQNFGSSQNKKASAMPTKNVIPSISAIPDLDFIAPKNRTSKK